MSSRSSTSRARLLAIVLLTCVCGTGFAHDLRLARFSLARDEQPGAYELHVQGSPYTANGRNDSANTLTLPEQCQRGASNQDVRGGELRVTVEFTCGRPLRQGDSIGVPWGEDGAVFTSMLGGASPTAVLLQGSGGTVFLPAVPAGTDARPLSNVAYDYAYLGIAHILDGADHLAFVLCLCLPTSGLRLLSLITAFTLGHSISLALAFLGVVHVPAPPVEAAIALSIAFMAREVLLAKRGPASASRDSCFSTWESRPGNSCSWRLSALPCFCCRPSAWCSLCASRFCMERAYSGCSGPSIGPLRMSRSNGKR